MKKSSGRFSAYLAACLITGGIIAILLSGCAAPQGEGFGIYLTQGDIPPARMPVLSHVDIAERPLIAMGDIVTYNGGTHEIGLTADAYQRISTLDVPVTGRSFVVCVDRRPIYWGAFWTPLSSASFHGVTIMKPLGPQDKKVVKLELGYPSPSFHRGEDPRASTQVMESLRRAGKLR